MEVDENASEIEVVEKASVTDVDDMTSVADVVENASMIDAAAEYLLVNPELGILFDPMVEAFEMISSFEHDLHIDQTNSRPTATASMTIRVLSEFCLTFCARCVRFDRAALTLVGREVGMSFVSTIDAKQEVADSSQSLL